MSLIPGLHKSPLRYPGGKGKVANYVKLLMLENGLIGRDYVEPYAGGASVALELLFEDYADTIHINDLNPGVHCFWQAVLEETAELCDRIESTPVTMDEWHRQRAVANSGDSNGIDLGFATFFLNRTNRSGIISGGVIGGKDQTGEWKLDARYNTADLIARIRKIGRHRTRIDLTNLDASEFLLKWTATDEPPSFIYLDPPYFVKGAGLYDNFYGPDDHASVAAMVRELAHPWIVSYDAAPPITSLYQGFDHMRYSLSYSANTRGLGSEIMFFSPGLRRPEQTPGRVTARDVLDARRSPSQV
jgi:DNA adenine methylase